MHTFTETGPGVPAFLAKLWRLVEDVTTDNLISWSPDGKSFFIHNQAQFARELLPLNYKHNNMASFIRQLNMYGFHKITSIDNGGLKFDRDDMEFSHPCFLRGHSYLLENIKRKIAHPKQMEDKGLLKSETVNKVLNEVKIMRGRQDTLDSRFSAMKQENEALWREIAVLRQKHLKQQQIVNKLIQFLVTIVQPQRTGLSGMGEKRRYQLMINDTPQAAKIRRQTNDGPVIHDISEDLLDDVAQEEAELINNFVPDVQSPATTVASTDVTSPDNEYILEDAINNDDDYYFTTSPNENQAQYRPGAPSSESVDLENELSQSVCPSEISDEFNVFDETENILTTPMVKREMEREGTNVKRENRNVKQIRTLGSRTTATKTGKSILKKSNKSLNNNIVNQNESNVKLINDGDQMQQEPQQKQQPINKTATAPYIKNEKQMYTNQEDFLCTEMPNELFEDDTAHHTEDPMIGGIHLVGESYPGVPGASSANKKTETGETSQASGSNKNNWAVSTTPKSDILKFNTANCFDQHLENFQGELDSLKDLLHEGGLVVDPATILGKAYSYKPEYKISGKVANFATLNEIEQYLKLFSDGEQMQPYEISMPDNKNIDYNRSGSEVMTYQPALNCDLSELLDDDSGPGNTDSLALNNESTSGMDTLNTPQYISDFQPFKNINSKNMD